MGTSELGELASEFSGMKLYNFLEQLEGKK